MLTPRQFEQLGREVFTKHPELARQIIGENSIYPDIQDLGKVPLILELFLNHQGNQVHGKSQSEIQARKTFLMVLILCFHAEARKTRVRIRHGLYSAAAKALGTSISITRKHANNARAEYNIYKEFKNQVDSLYQKIAKCCLNP